MFNWFNCYLSGRHEFGVKCEPGAIFLHCIHCGRRSSGWSLADKTKGVRPPAARGASTSPVVTAAAPAPSPGRALPFGRAVS
jgi:hypothetical protein